MMRGWGVLIAKQAFSILNSSWRSWRLGGSGSASLSNLMKNMFAALALTVPPLLVIAFASEIPTSTPSAEDDLDGGNNKLRASPNDVHGLILDETPAVFREGTTETLSALPCHAVHTSREIAADFPFNDVVPSWNVDVPPASGFVVELRFRRADGGTWTPFYYLGKWGDTPTLADRITETDDGVIDIDYFRSQHTFDRIQYRLHLFAPDEDHAPRPRRVGLAYSNTLDDAGLAREHRRPIDPGPKASWVRRLPVPFRSQKDEDPSIRGDICSPTSTGMVMAFRGVDQPTAEVARVVYDREYRLYGNWARAVQTAYSFGVPGYIERFGDWDAVKRHVAHGQPVIASIRVARGELQGAPYRASNGHLLVIAGFDDDGNVHVNDPAAATRDAGIATYGKHDMETVWLAHGGVGYVLLAPSGDH